MIEGHGDDLYRYGDLVKVNFSSNIYQHVDLSGLTSHLAAIAPRLLTSYPEPEPRSLEKLIAEKEDIDPESVLVTNGATEAIYMIAELLHGSVSIIPQPTFNEYADACRMYRHIIAHENTTDLKNLPRDRVYWICNPNNPSGNVLLKSFMDYLVRRSPRYTFVVDQSYEGYTREPMLKASEMEDVSNLLLIHSFSKTYSIPGLRLGYVTGHPSTIQLLRSLRRPWSVGGLAIEAGHYLLTVGSPSVPNLKAYLAETERLRTEMRSIPGVRVFETKTNYMLCELETVQASDLKQYLIQSHGMLIRDCSNFFGLSSHFFRVAAQQPEENDALIAAIREYLIK